jgi:hypothetical protein
VRLEKAFLQSRQNTAIHGSTVRSNFLTDFSENQRIHRFTGHGSSSHGNFPVLAASLLLMADG